MQEKYSPPNLQHEIDPAIEDFIQFKDYIPPPSNEKKKDDSTLPFKSRSSILSSSSTLSPSSSPLSRRSYSSPIQKITQTPIHDQTNMNFSASEYDDGIFLHI